MVYHSVLTICTNPLSTVQKRVNCNIPIWFNVVWQVLYNVYGTNHCSQVAKLRVPYMVRLSCPIPPLRAPKSRFNSFRLPFNTCREHFHGEVLSKPISVYFLNQSQAGLMSIEQIGVISITMLHQNFDPRFGKFPWPIQQYECDNYGMIILIQP